MGKIGHTATEARKASAEQEGEKEFWAIKDVSFDVQPGEVVGVIGRNGAGKSTLLKILSRITEPSTGEVELNGRLASLLEVGTGFHPELTGRENVYMNGTILGMKRREIEATFDEIIAFSELEKFIDTPVKRYSSGMYVRLAFAVAAHLEPEILLVDEVLAVGDAQFQVRCLGRMENIARSGRTILFVSHNMAAIQALCQRAILVEDGRIAAQGPVQDVIARYVRRVISDIGKLGERTDRGGDGTVRFVRAILRDAQGHELVVVPSGSDLLVDLVYELKTGCEVTGIIRLAVVDGDGQPLFLCFSKVSHNRPLRMQGRGVVRCFIPKLPLLPGRYWVNLSCKNDKTLVDEVSQAFHIDVIEGNFFGTGKINPRDGGSMLVQHSWSVLTPPES
jgi:lipopolysaccharide transport system ATP-binding protein